MSSNVPVRRTTRTLRTAPVQKDKENAVRTRSTRVKPPSSSAAPASSTSDAKLAVRSAAPAVATRATKSTAPSSTRTSETLAQGKRKREALGEVPRPAPNLARPSGVAADAKGKAKEKFDGVVLKQTTTTTSTTRQPLKHTGGSTAPVSTASTTTRRTRHTVVTRHTKPLDDVKEEDGPAVLEPRSHDDNAMAVDRLPAPVPSPRRFAHARDVAAGRASATTSRSHHSSSRHISKPEDDEEDNRVFKKRRTSSEAPEDDVHAQAEVEAAVQLDEDFEADPDGDQWNDLDAEDADDPLMVSEYVVEIFEYLKETEQTTMPNPNYMEMQKDLAWKMRGILTDWLIQVHSRFRLLPETLFLCVNIIDRFLSQRVVSLAKLQLVGITCMFIAAKVEEIVAPSASNFLYCADSSYTEGEILQAERYVLKTLDWNLSYPNPMHFLRRISKADNYNVQSRTVAKYLIEVQCLEWRLIAAPPSLLAAASVWLARLILGFTDWTANLAHYSSYRESDLIPTANLLLNYILKPLRHQSFYRKYAGKRYLKSSVFVRDWAVTRWGEGQQVSLFDELPALKRDIRLANRGGNEPLADALELGQDA